MVNVLFLVIEYAPYQTTGAYRTIFFTKYLNRHGIRPIVLTIKAPDNSKEYQNKLNEAMLNDIGEDTVLIQAELKDLSYSKNRIIAKLQQYFKIHDRYTKFWKEAVMEKLPSIMEEYKPKAIYTSVPFFSQASLAVNISKNYNLPFILDLRDNWSKWSIGPYASYIHYFLTFLKERRALAHAKKLITVTEELKDVFVSSHSLSLEEKFEVIPNGFDAQIDLESNVQFSKLLPAQDRKVKIAYVGNYYYDPQKHHDMYLPWYKKSPHKIIQYRAARENWLYRSPYFFLKTLEGLFKNFSEYKDKIIFQHYGSMPAWLSNMLSDMDLLNNFEEKGFLPKEELDKEIESADFFLGTSVKVENGKDYAIASKTFDYLAVKKPVLAFVTEGAQRSFIERSNCGIVFDPDELEENIQKMNEILKFGLELELNKDYVRSFERKHTAEKLGKVFQKLLIDK